MNQIIRVYNKSFNCPFLGSEMDVVAALCMNNKQVFVLHPLFDAFIQLKWTKTSTPYYIYLSYTFIYTFLLIFNALEQFPTCILHGKLPENFFIPLLKGLLPISIIEKIISLFLYFNVISDFLCRKNLTFDGLCWTMFMMNFVKLLIWNIVHPLLLGVLLFMEIDPDEKRMVTSCLIFLASFFNLIVLSEIPSIGIHLMMIKRVLISATKFFLSFFIVLFSFCLVFHLLLPNTPSFTRLDDAFIKILAMLMGELDFTNSIARNPEAGFFAKMFFFTFVITMALVFMNLLLGIAVSDINELERISKTHSVIIRCLTIEYMEKIFLAIRWVAVNMDPIS